VGEIEMPMKVGTKGASLETNPSVRINHQILGAESATELAGVMAAVGLAQNFAALRALSTAGIQQGHMTLHARSVASTAGAPEAIFDQVVDALIESGEIKVWKAEEIIRNLTRRAAAPDQVQRSSACGKVILLGEHAVVYGRPAIALPVPLAVEAHVREGGDGVQLVIPRWGLEQRVAPDQRQGVSATLNIILEALDVVGRPMLIEVMPHLPRAMGLGASAALAVAVIRAIGDAFELGLTDDFVNQIAFECEKTAHGTPSGIDNTVATYGSSVQFQTDGKTPRFKELRIPQALPLVIGITGEESLTAKTVAGVRAAWTEYPERYEAIFDQIADLTTAGADAIAAANFNELGQVMNLCHGYLNALQLSTPALEAMVHIARDHGASGAKLTGGGGGGSMVALCPDSQEQVAEAMRTAGFKALSVTVGG
ncbi:MAG: mevalonate kinase, partial [Gammaproteobacteria bacterium]|nr:mevalonate kinase [Gammaproteobacteria bacterium]MYK27596.1 mevalonate kinase [Gammaproteobacteria bacterium]